MVKFISSDASLQWVTISVQRKSSSRIIDQVTFVLGTDARLVVEANDTSPNPKRERNDLVSYLKAQEVVAKHVANRLKNKCQPYMIAARICDTTACALKLLGKEFTKTVIDNTVPYGKEQIVWSDGFVDNPSTQPEFAEHDLVVRGREWI